MPIMEMAWSMPPDSVPTYLSQVVVNSATSYGQARLDHVVAGCMLSGTHTMAERCMLLMQGTVQSAALDDHA